MAYSKSQKISEGGESQTVWLKFKERDIKGKTITTFQGSVDMGGGKMLKISLYADLKPVCIDGVEMIGAYVSKWKSDRPSASRGTKKSW